MKIKFMIIGYRDVAYSTISDDGLGYYGTEQTMVIEDQFSSDVQAIIRDGYEYKKGYVIDVVYEQDKPIMSYYQDTDTFVFRNCMRVFNSYKEEMEC